MADDAGAVWQPAAERTAATRIARYRAWLAQARDLDLDDYDGLWRWSVGDLDAFWQSIWDFFDVEGQRGEVVMAPRAMPFARWFPGARVNYARRLLAASGGKPAILAVAEEGPVRVLSRDDVRGQAASLAEALVAFGVQPGDRVAGYLPNIPETVVAFAAAASIGAVWTCCAPEFGAPSVLDRFRQVEPKVLIVANGYRYRGRELNRDAVIDELRRGLPSVEHVVYVPYPDADAQPPEGASRWQDLVSSDAEWTPVDLPFDHPLWILYSSGTTGMPKPIVHGHGGVLLEHLKSHGLHLDVNDDDAFFWYTSTGWVMWNLQIAALLFGASIVLFDGDPMYPSSGRLWSLADECGLTVFGASASFYESCLKAGTRAGADNDLARLRCVGSTGSPLTTSAFRWIYDAVKPDVWVMSFSGGTDVATAFVGGNPTLPVREGEIQCRWLGVDAVAFDAAGEVTDGIGELVIRQPMPSMPLYLWGDTDGTRYRESYFATFPGAWRHGDWIHFTESGGAIIHGRSDSTINRRGVRMGTGEIYRVIESMPEITDSLVVDLEGLSGASRLIAFVVLADGAVCDQALLQRLRSAIRRDVSPRHVPDTFLPVDGVPRTLNGKKLEVPVKRILLGADPADVVNLDAVADPDTVAPFAVLGRAIRAELAAAAAS